MNQIVQKASPDWLDLRRPADALARATTLPAVHRLSTRLASPPFPDPLQVLDLGAGTGANLFWLAPHLAVPQRWTLIDRDSELLAAAPTCQPTPAVLEVQHVVAELDDLPRLHPLGAGPALVTCSALLDVLTRAQVAALGHFVADTGSAALFSMTVSGMFQLEPASSLDPLLLEAFNEHQERTSLAGPSATAIAAEVLRGRGLDVEIIATPWELTADQQSLVEAYLGGVVTAVCEQDGTLDGPAHDWLVQRLTQLRDGALTVRVSHEDLLAMPGTP